MRSATRETIVKLADDRTQDAGNLGNGGNGALPGVNLESIPGEVNLDGQHWVSFRSS
jgi:hypothetical protein